MANEQELITGYHSIHKLAEVIASAEYNIFIVGYKLTSEKALESLITARKRGIEIKLVFDGKEARENNSLLPIVMENDIETRIWDTRKNGKLHTKMYIIDEKILVIGSFNLSESAEKSNYELIFKSSQDELLEQALKEWEKIWRSAGSD